MLAWIQAKILYDEYRESQEKITESGAPTSPDGQKKKGTKQRKPKPPLRVAPHLYFVIFLQAIGTAAYMSVGLGGIIQALVYKDCFVGSFRVSILCFSIAIVAIGICAVVFGVFNYMRTLRKYRVNEVDMTKDLSEKAKKLSAHQLEQRGSVSVSVLEL